MRKHLVTAAMVGLIMTATAVPTWAMIGVAKPENPDLMVITSVEEKPAVDQDGTPLKEVKTIQTAEKIWYVTSPEEEAIVNSQEYRVVKGDSLWKIMRTIMKTKNPAEIARGVVEVSQLNHLHDANLIIEGSTLRLPQHLIR